MSLIKIKRNTPLAGGMCYDPDTDPATASRSTTLTMQLTKFTDYALRVLLLAASNPERNTTIREAAEVYGISHAHLKKVVLKLSRDGYLEATRGHGGGFRLGLPPEQINLGALIRATETDFALVECFHPNASCAIASRCVLPGILDEALAAFLKVMDQYTLQDIALQPDTFALGA